MKSSIQTVGKIIFSLVLSAVILSCENPFQAGLGKKVDLLPPVINWTEPGPGLFVRGEENVIFRAHVTDDMAVANVYIFFWRQDEMEPKDDEVNRRFTMTPSAGMDNLNENLREAHVWAFILDVQNQQINGRDISDGELFFRIVAYDTSDKIDFKKMSCIIKSRPPAVTVSYPYLAVDF